MLGVGLMVMLRLGGADRRSGQALAHGRGGGKDAVVAQHVGTRAGDQASEASQKVSGLQGQAGDATGPGPDKKPYKRTTWKNS